MRKLFAVLIALGAIALATAPASAGCISLLGAGKACGVSGGGGGGGTPTFSANDHAQQSLGFGSATATFTAATGTGLVVVTVQAETNNANLTGVTLNGNAMTLAVAANVAGGGVSNRISEIWYLAGQTANAGSTIVLTGASVFNAVGIQTSTLTNVTALPTATATFPSAAPASPYSVGPITVPATGFGIVSARWQNTNTYTPGTGVTDDFTDTTIYEGKLAHMGAGSSLNATWTGTSFDSFTAAFAAWGP